MAARTSQLADAEESIHGARHGAPDEQQVSLDVHSHDPQAELRETARAHVPRHPLPLDDARGVRPRRDRPGLAVTRVAVRLGAPAEVMAMHHALKARSEERRVGKECRARWTNSQKRKKR